jgi:hypothetical protein
MIPDCPGLSRSRQGAPTFKDSAGQTHDLTTAPTLTYKEAAADRRLAHLGFGTINAIGELVTAGRLYPVFRKNPRVIYIFDPALTDFRTRALAITAR